jgi:hypothetical protein
VYTRARNTINVLPQIQKTGGAATQTYSTKQAIRCWHTSKTMCTLIRSSNVMQILRKLSRHPIDNSPVHLVLIHTSEKIQHVRKYPTHTFISHFFRFRVIIYASQTNVFEIRSMFFQSPHGLHFFLKIK